MDKNFLSNVYGSMFKGYPDIVTPAQAKEMLHVGKNKIYELLDSGKLPSYKVGKTYRIPKACVIEYMLEYAKTK
jgi:excisionase family DNA binding protein